MKRKNAHLGPTLKEAVQSLKNADPEFALLYNDEKAKEKLSLALKRIRRNLGLTQEQVARIAGVSQALIGRLEGKGGRLLPAIRSFNRVLDALGYETQLLVRKKAA